MIVHNVTFFFSNFVYGYDYRYLYRNRYRSDSIITDIRKPRINSVMDITFSKQLYLVKKTCIRIVIREEWSNNFNYIDLLNRF